MSPLALGAQHHRHQPLAVPQAAGHQTVPRLRRGAGLAAVHPVIEIIQNTPVGEQRVGGVQLPCLGLVGGRHLIGHGAGDGHEGLMLHGLPEEQIDIVGGGIVVHIVQAVGVGKVGAGAAQLLRPLVHQLHKGLTGAGYRLRQNVRRLVGGHQQQAVQQLFHRQHLALLDAGGAALRVLIVHHRRCGDGLVQRQLPGVHGLQRQQGRHHLGDAGGVFPLLLILPKDDPPRIGVHQYGRLGLDLQRRQGIGLRGQHQTDHQHGQQKNR